MDTDLNIPLGEAAVDEEPHGAVVDEEHEHAMDEDLQLVEHYDLNMNPEEHDGDALHGEMDLHESDESDYEVEDGAFNSTQEELEAMDKALEELQVHPDDSGVYAGYIDVELSDKDLDDMFEQGENDEQQQGENDEQQQGENDEQQQGGNDERQHGENDEQRHGENDEQRHGESKYKNLTDAQRSSIFTELLARSKLNRKRELILPRNATEDLGLFASLQSMTDLLVSNNLDQLIRNVEQQYNAYDADKINRVFLTLQSCLLEVMKKGGGNGYKIPHMYKDGLERAGNLPDVLECDRELYESVMQILAA